MKRTLTLFLLLGILISCKKDTSENVNYGDYLNAAVRHCGSSPGKLNWLQTIVTSARYQKPGASVPAPIRQISLSTYEGGRVFLLDSDLSSCVVCPWAILDCDGQSFPFPFSKTPVREKVIWKK